MARHEQPREDLLRDATALSPRVELSVNDRSQRVFAGFRGESLSLYVGDDPAYHFNAEGLLRRAYAGGKLIKAESGRLIGLDRVRTADSVELRRGRLHAGDQQRFLAALEQQLAWLREALAGGAFVIVGESPPEGDAVVRLRRWLDAHLEIGVAPSPRIDD